MVPSLPGEPHIGHTGDGRQQASYRPVEAGQVKILLACFCIRDDDRDAQLAEHGHHVLHRGTRVQLHGNTTVLDGLGQRLRCEQNHSRAALGQHRRLIPGFRRFGDFGGGFRIRALSRVHLHRGEGRASAKGCCQCQDEQRGFHINTFNFLVRLGWTTYGSWQWRVDRNSWHGRG